MTTRDERPPNGPIEPGQLPLVQAPEAIWRSIEAALDAKTEPPSVSVEVLEEYYFLRDMVA